MIISAPNERRFGGISRLYGQAALQRFAQAHVCVVGVGGVGSWAVEALARSGIGRLTLIDLDNVAESNTNRQLHALTDNFGLPKVTALHRRILQINPACTVHEIEECLYKTGSKEVPSRLIGELVMEQLAKLDQVAYVRFASVYKSFKDVAEFTRTVAGLERTDPS